MSWDLRETYIDGLTEDPEVPFTRQRDMAAAWRSTQNGPQVRKAQGATVIDITAMIKELDANPEARQRR